ncbi:DUF6624 domain-containing protein [Rheinheimera texasensis]|uniref:DUF6624 domain-containing protein n=1 Tax=Rheinheimera texasensis TaxID=306205 RepID=UPI0032B1BDE4
MAGANASAEPSQSTDWRYLQQHSLSELQSQQQALQQRFARLSAAEAEQLLALELAFQSADQADYQANLQQVQQAVAAYQALVQQVEAGWVQAAWLGNRWLRLRADAKTAAEQQLFMRTFLEQFEPEPDLAAKLHKAFAVALQPIKQQIYLQNQRWLQQQLQAAGWFDISKTSADASQAAWLMVQHADWDPQWQQQVLQLLQPKVKQGEFQPRYFAYLADRVAINTGQPQHYGTQGACDNQSGQWQPFAVENVAQLDSKRQEMELEPIEQYRKKFRCTSTKLKPQSGAAVPQSRK